MNFLSFQWLTDTGSENPTLSFLDCHHTQLQEYPLFESKSKTVKLIFIQVPEVIDSYICKVNMRSELLI